MNVNIKKFLGLLFFTWAIGYFAAMMITTKGLPSIGLVFLIAIGGVLYGMGLKDDGNDKNR